MVNRKVPTGVGTLLLQTITFNAIPDRTLAQSLTFSVAASTDSGLDVFLAASGACSVLNKSVTITGAGMCSLTASQVGDGTYAAAADVVRSFAVWQLSLPANTLAPSISGTAKVATQLTGSPGTWGGYPAPSTPYAYAWFSCTGSGSASATKPSNCTAISGATASTFTPTSTQVGKYLRLKVTASNTSGSTFYFSAATATVAAAAANTTAPAVSGTLKVGSTLTGSQGSWSGTPTPTYGFVWARCSATGSASATLPGTCALIDGAASSTYALASADYNNYLRVGVTATNSAGSATMYSAATAIIAGGLPANTLAPSISGTAKVATQLTGSPGTWGGYPAPSTPYAYAWFSCTGSGSASATKPSNCTAISGATASTFTPTSTQVGKYLRLKVTASNTSGSTFYFSAATAKVIR